MSDRAGPVIDPTVFLDVERYIGDLFAPHDEVLAAIEQSVIDEQMPQISVSATEGKLLHVLALLINARNILEIGTLAGYSTVWLARALPADGRLISIEAAPSYAVVARRNIERAGLSARVVIRVGKGLDVLPQLESEGAGPFDLIFIDADKPPYTEYFAWALKLARRGTLIVADNVIREGAVLHDSSDDDKVSGARRFNAALAANPAVSAVVLQTVGAKGHDGMAFAVVR